MLSHPVITGLVNAAAIPIIASQLSAFTGVAAERDGLPVAALDLDAGLGIATTGEVPSGLPEFALPPFNPLMWLALMPSSAMIAAVAFVESYTMGTSPDNREPSDHLNSTHC